MPPKCKKAAALISQSRCSGRDNAPACTTAFFFCRRSAVLHIAALICEKGRSFAGWQGLHESKEILLLATAEIVIPRFHRIRLKDFQSLNDLPCPQQSPSGTCSNQAVVCNRGAINIEVLSFVMGRTHFKVSHPVAGVWAVIQQTSICQCNSGTADGTYRSTC